MSDSSWPKSFNLPNDRPALMGILNVTPDSFSDGGRHFSKEAAIVAGLRMVSEGADLIDVGGESTRPGAEAVPLEEEIRRVVPVVSALTEQGVSVSIDTMKPAVAREAVAAGACVVNDVSGLRDPAMGEVVLEARCSVCVMHMQGEPRSMQARPSYADVVGEIRDYLREQARPLREAGMPSEAIWIDPGIGFGKTVDHNLQLLNALDEFVELGFPVLIGVSRKSFIGKLFGWEEAPASIDQRLEGALAAQVVAQTKGVRIIRTHDVSASRRVVEFVRRLGEV